MPTQCSKDNLRVGDFIQVQDSQWVWGRVTYIDHYNHSGKVEVTVRLAESFKVENFWIESLAKLEFITPELAALLDEVEKIKAVMDYGNTKSDLHNAFLKYKESIKPKITASYLRSLTFEQLNVYCKEMFPHANDEIMLLQLYRNGKEIKATNMYSVQLAYAIWKLNQ